MKLTKQKSNGIRNLINLKHLIIVLLMPLLLLSATDEAYSKKTKKSKRSRKYKKTRVYNSAKTKRNAIDILKNSEELSELAGLEAEPNSSANPANESTDLMEKYRNEGVDDVTLLKTFLQPDEAEALEGEFGEDIAELELEDDIKVNLDDFKSLWLLAIGGVESEKTAYGADKEAIMGIIMDWLGTPYRFGGTSRSAIDCSAWVRAVFYQADSILLPRTAREQVHLGRKVNREQLVFGDLIFFHTYSRKFASHVGIYLGDDKFAHASSAVGVTVSSLNSTYYAKRFIGGRRFNEADYASYKIAKNADFTSDY